MNHHNTQNKEDAKIKGYTEKKCNSVSIPITDFGTCISKFENAQVVVWYYDSIEYYQINDKEWSNGDLRKTWQEEIVRLRIFDENQELHIWRSNGKLNGRLRIDEGESKDGTTSFVEAKQVINGTIANAGLLIKGEKKTKSKIAIITRNYIGYNDIEQAGYEDCRFVEFCYV